MTNQKKRLLSGVLAMTVGLSLAMPMRALAHDWDNEQHHKFWSHRADDDGYWRRHHDDDDDRAYPRQWNDDDDYWTNRSWANRNHYWTYRNRALPPNGEGMINRRNPNFFWACDGDGHHCHWARR